MVKSMANSRISGFYNLSVGARRGKLAESAEIPADLLSAYDPARLGLDAADHMVENVVGTFALPVGIGLNFQVNGRDVLVPMAIEEPSVVAGASYMAKLARAGGGFIATTDEPLMIGQMQVINLDNLEAARLAIFEHKAELLAEADSIDPVLQKFGGGARDLDVRSIDDSPIGPFLVVHLLYDVRDAMGANAVNTACERLAPRVEAITGGRVHLRILSNLADRRLARVRCKIPAGHLAFGDEDAKYSGERVRDGIIAAYAFAAADPYRAATHNKGIMNGVDAVVIATGNDWRAIEAGAHAYAARSGRYTSLATWRGEGDFLLGRIEMPMALGTVGGTLRVHPAARLSLRLLAVTSAQELAMVAASLGLASNLAAVRALATCGI